MITLLREVFGKPLRGANVEFSEISDLSAKVKYTGVEVIKASMNTKKWLEKDIAVSFLELPQINLKLIPGATKDSLDVTSLTCFEYKNIKIEHFKTGDYLDFEMNNHVNVPLKMFQNLDLIGGLYIDCCMDLSAGETIYNFLEKKGKT